MSCGCLAGYVVPERIMIVQILITAGYTEYPLHNHTLYIMTDTTLTPVVIFCKNFRYSFCQTNPFFCLTKKQNSAVSADITVVKIQMNFTSS
jgi:hypothetical protein